MRRALGLGFGVICYLIFLAVFLRAIWFVWSMDASTAQVPWVRALITDAILLALFAVQHSGMARQGFKRAWTQIVARPLERSAYVLVASAVLFAVVYFWQPIPAVIWNVQAGWAVMLLNVLFWLGWGILLISTFLINHFDLFGLKQVWGYWQGKPYDPPEFRIPGFYQFVRHPIYVGFLVAFWSAPRMTAGHLFFSVMCTGYILVAIQFEERDLITFHGEEYKVYRSGVSMLVPWPRKKLPS
ncbi:MAG TPA: isoprenylcysteine carboxylmethyltransferase family protein [Candidatus Acidoferrales bacterium]|nr:isoprenylcysteine carboxylmethyltransferase family protein [Candidatus Acidoferrales bacterium]